MNYGKRKQNICDGLQEFLLVEEAHWNSAKNALFCSVIPHVLPLPFNPFALRVFRTSCVCVTLQQSAKLHIFPPDYSVSKTELPSVSARKYAPFHVHSVKRHRKPVLYYTHKYIRMTNRGLIRGWCKLFLHRGQIGFGTHQISYLADTTSPSSRSKAPGAWNRFFFSLYLRR